MFRNVHKIAISVGLSLLINQGLAPAEELVVAKVDTQIAGSAATISRGEVLPVEKSRADAIWTSAVETGWVPKADVLPLEEGLLHFLAQLEANPKDDVAYTALGNIMLAKGAEDDAIKNYDQAIALNPGNWRAHSKRAIARARQGERDAALADADQGVVLSAGDPYALAARGIVKCLLQQTEGAIGDFTAAIAKNPKYARAFLFRGRIRERADDRAGALGDYSRAIALDPNDRDALHRRANLQARLHSCDEAIADYQKALQLDEDNAALHDCLAWTLLRCPEPENRDAQKALDHAKRANELTGYSNLLYLESLVKAYEQLGDAKNALEWRMKLLKLKIAHNAGTGKAPRPPRKADDEAAAGPPVEPPEFRVFRYNFR